MIRRLLMPLVLLCLVGVPPAAADKAPALKRTSFVIAAGTAYETSGYVLESGRPGPTVFLTAGIHGDEPAGYRAARQVAGWTLTRGRLIVIPRANERSLGAGSRYMPGLGKDKRDLNRQFPRRAEQEPKGTLAKALWKRVLRDKPTHLLDLHEGYDFTQRSGKSVGSSVISARAEEALDLAGRMVAALNAEIRTKDKHFVVKNGAVGGSLARAAADRLEIPSFILETTTRGQSLAYRTRQHRILVHAALTALEMVEHGAHRRFGTLVGEGDTRIGLYWSTGASGRGPGLIEKQIEAAPHLHVRRLSSTDVKQGDFGDVDVLLFPGGSASKQAKALTSMGRKHVCRFVSEGGGYVGICAGAYLAAANYSWSLKILDANVIDRAHWARGRGQVPVEIPLFSPLRGNGDQRLVKILYANGPIYEPAEREDIPDFDVLATYEGEVVKKGVPSGVMPGTAAVVRGAFGAGRVVCCGPHPEQTKGQEALLLRMIALARRDR